ncbi:NifU family protein, partial [Candidatus Pelagibacter sp.]|nr:NifU family protein [Candidatus Pelagibacter sp.]
MFVQTEITPNPNSLKFLPGKTVSNDGSFEITKKEKTDNELVRNLLSINGVTGIFLGKDFISVNKSTDIDWEEIKHIAISLINEFYSSGKEFVIESSLFKENKTDLEEIEKKIIKILDTKIRPAVAKDGGDIKFKEFKNGTVK